MGYTVSTATPSFTQRLEDNGRTVEYFVGTTEEITLISKDNLGGTYKLIYFGLLLLVLLVTY